MAKAKKAATPTTLPYPEERVEIFTAASGNPITRDKVKAWLGWTVVEKGGDFMDVAGNQIVCKNNFGNRPFERNLALKYGQDMLNKRWKKTLETMIIGKSGRIISAQHRFVGLEFANQIRESEAQKYHWEEIWPTEVTIDGLVAFGADEDKETIRAIDNVRPRSLLDVLCTDPDLFGKLPKKVDRKGMLRALDYCIKFLWHRLGRDRKEINQFSQFRTHGESVAFFEAHKRMLDCVKHIAEEDRPIMTSDKINKEGEVVEKGSIIAKALSRWVGQGSAAGLLFLMGQSDSDGDTYRNADNPSQKQLNWKNWDKACKFFVDLAAGYDIGAKSPLTKALREVCRPSDENSGEFEGHIFAEGEGKGSPAEKAVVFAKMWHNYLTDDKITAHRVTPEYLLQKNDDGTIASITLADSATFGGADMGDNEAERVAEETTEPEATPEPETNGTPEEDRRTKAERLAEKLKAMRAKEAPKEEPVASE